MKRYRLLKELPTFNAGDIFTLGEDGCLYLTEPCDFNHHWKSRVMAYHKNTLSSFPNILEDWFEEIESKEYYCIDWTEPGVYKTDHEDERDDFNKAIGNYFETKEEAEKAVDKLKAWKRLKDKGFRFCGWATNEGIRGVDFEVPDSFFSEHNHSCISDETRDDLDLLFGGEQ